MEIWILIAVCAGVIFEVFNIGIEGAISMTVLRLLKVMFFVVVGLLTIIVRVSRKAFSAINSAFKKLRENQDEQRKITQYFRSKEGKLSK